MITFTKKRLKRILTEGYSEQLNALYPGGRFEPLQYLMQVDFEGEPLPPLQLNQRFRRLEMVSYIGFRSALLVLLALFALDMSGLLGDWRTHPGLSYQLIMGTESLALLVMLLSIPFKNSPYWLMEPPATGYIDRIVGRNAVLRAYRSKVRLLGRNETLMELSLYEQYDQEMAQQRQQGESKLKQARRKKRALKQQH